MQIAIHNSEMIIVDHMNNNIPGSIHYKNSMFKEYLSHGSATYEFALDKFINGEPNKRIEKIDITSYFSFKLDGDDYIFNVIDFDDSKGTTITVRGETLNMALLNSKVGAFEADKAYKIEDYFKILGIFKTTKIEIGINELYEHERTLKWTGESTYVERILSIVSGFDGECKIRSILHSNGQLDKLVVDIYRARRADTLEYGVGTHRKDVRLFLSKYQEGITRNITKRNLFNAIKVIGKDGNYLKVTKERKIVNEQGLNEIIAPRRSDTIYAPLSMKMFPSITKINNCDNWTERTFKTEYETEDEFWRYGSSMLRKYMYPEVEYEIPIEADPVIKRYNLKCGDSIYFTDDHYFNKLIVLARISERHISDTNPDRSKLIFTSYIEIKNQTPKSLTEMMNEVAEKSAPVVMDIVTTNGTSFINGIGESEVKPSLRRGNKVLDNSVFTYYLDGKIVGSGTSFNVTAGMIKNRLSVLTIEGMSSDGVTVKMDVTFTVIDSGKPGKPGEAGVGISKVVLYYLLSDKSSGVTKETEGWTTEPLLPTEEKKYLWSYRHEEYTNATEIDFAPFIVSIFTKDGRDGQPGPPGPPGDSDKVYTAYADIVEVGENLSQDITKTINFGIKSSMLTLTKQLEYNTKYTLRFKANVVEKPKIDINT